MQLAFIYLLLTVFMWAVGDQLADNQPQTNMTYGPKEHITYEPIVLMDSKSITYLGINWRLNEYSKLSM